MFHIFTRINGQMMKTARKMSLYEAFRCAMQMGDAIADSGKSGWMLLLDEHGRLLERHIDGRVGDKMYGYRDMDEWLEGGFTLTSTGYDHNGYATSSIEMKCATLADADQAMRMLVDQTEIELQMRGHKKGEMNEIVISDVKGKACRWVNVISDGWLMPAIVEEIDAADL